MGSYKLPFQGKMYTTLLYFLWNAESTEAHWQSGNRAHCGSSTTLFWSSECKDEGMIQGCWGITMWLRNNELTFPIFSLLHKHFSLLFAITTLTIKAYSVKLTIHLAIMFLFKANFQSLKWIAATILAGTTCAFSWQRLLSPWALAHTFLMKWLLTRHVFILNNEYIRSSF